MTAEPDFDLMMLILRLLIFYIIIQKQKELSALQEKHKTQAIKSIFIRVLIRNQSLRFCETVSVNLRPTRGEINVDILFSFFIYF